MQTSLYALAVAAGTTGVLHTAAGPDHYLPFVVLAKANRWRWWKLLAVTLLCGAGHVLSSVVIGLLAVGGLASVSHLSSAAGAPAANVQDLIDRHADPRLDALQEHRGTLAGYLLLGFGMAYFLWGLRRSRTGQRHAHVHAHTNGSLHSHEHEHQRAHAHVHPAPNRNLFWSLFIIFVLGPCELLIPMVMAGYSLGKIPGVLLVSTTFSLATIATMLCIVTVIFAGLAQLRTAWLERHAHALGGAVIASCAAAMLWLGL